MSNFNITVKCRKTSQEYHVACLDNYFGRRRFGYKFPDGKILTVDELHKDYEWLDSNVIKEINDVV